ncbi:hypothetical protein D9615_006027 [Tricholomella constricta]|uniref:Uncharacterized protein n=1 Tax=Tricholomella constricta TaxID=117010 RepID=A0A8H5H9H2_9AGAR|nr:hypothetical protein D9615_006027 [Tricholomella constricta]
MVPSYQPFEGQNPSNTGETPAPGPAVERLHAPMDVDGHGAGQLEPGQLPDAKNRSVEMGRPSQQRGGNKPHRPKGGERAVEEKEGNPSNSHGNTRGTHAAPCNAPHANMGTNPDGIFNRLETVGVAPDFVVDFIHDGMARVVIGQLLDTIDRLQREVDQQTMAKRHITEELQRALRKRPALPTAMPYTNKRSRTQGPQTAPTSVQSTAPAQEIGSAPTSAAKVPLVIPTIEVPFPLGVPPHIDAGRIVLTIRQAFAVPEQMPVDDVRLVNASSPADEPMQETVEPSTIGTLKEEPASETADERSLRMKHNASVRRDRLAADREANERLKYNFETFVGRIPDTIGVLHINGTPERHNAFGGLLHRRLYWSPYSNTVFASQSASRALEYEREHKTAFNATGSPLYKCAPRGFPMSPRDIRNLVQFRDDNFNMDTERVEAHYLLWDFYRIASRYAEPHRDRTMKFILQREYFDPAHKPSIRDDAAWTRPVLPPPAGVLSTSARNPRTRGAGLPIPSVSQALDFNVWGQYIVHHGRPGLDNVYSGLVIDYNFSIHFRTVVGYALGRAISPTRAASRVAFMRLYAMIIARPNLYREAVDSWNAIHPLDRIPDHLPSTASLGRLALPEEHAANLTETDVIRTLLANQLPVAWIDHAYPYGLHYLDAHYTGTTIDRTLYDNVDDDRLVRLCRYGIPPAIPQWDGWRQPTRDDIARLHVLLDCEKERGLDTAHARGLHPVGYDITSMKFITGRDREATVLYDGDLVFNDTTDPSAPPPMVEGPPLPTIESTTSVRVVTG